jgi:hypothetical protein
MMHGRGKSDFAIVAVKPANKVARPVAEQSAAEPAVAEPVERRAETKGMRTSKARTGLKAGQACHRRWTACGKHLPFGPEVRAVCGKAACTDLRGGAQ